jgi:glycerate dehydrogenase
VNPVRIVALDTDPAFTNLDTAPLEVLGSYEGFAATGSDTLAARIADADIVLTNKVRLGAEQFAAAPRLKLVSVLATGYDMVDAAAAKAAGVAVCNVAGYSTASTAQTAIGLLLALTQGIAVNSALCADGEWTRRGIWSWSAVPLCELDGKTLAIVGYGAIGKRVGAIAAALGMNVVPVALPGREKPGHVALADALPIADVVSLNCPLTDSTRGLVNADFLNQLKPGARIVNAARGPVVDETAVAAALRAGTLAGYATDVLATEPPPADHPLVGAPNCVITPHLAWASVEARTRLLAETAANIAAFLAGNPRNRVA